MICEQFELKDGEGGDDLRVVKFCSGEGVRLVVIWVVM